LIKGLDKETELYYNGIAVNILEVKHYEKHASRIFDLHRLDYVSDARLDCL
jgi:hypothetical protein